MPVKENDSLTVKTLAAEPSPAEMQQAKDLLHNVDLIRMLSIPDHNLIEQTALNAAGRLIRNGEGRRYATVWFAPPEGIKASCYVAGFMG